jgi:hypothetical protein
MPSIYWHHLFNRPSKYNLISLIASLWLVGLLLFSSCSFPGGHTQHYRSTKSAAQHQLA